MLESSVKRVIQDTHRWLWRLLWLPFKIIFKIKNLGSQAPKPGPQALLGMISPRFCQDFQVRKYEQMLGLSRDDIDKLGLSGWHLLAFEPVDKDGGQVAVTRTVVYFHGGAYVKGLDPASYQLRLACELAHELNARVVVVPYPLAPSTTYKELKPRVLAVYEQLARIARHDGHELILSGESAGGGLSAAVLLHSSVETLPDASYLIAPWLDVTNRDPQVRASAFYDVMLSNDFMGRSARAYMHGTPMGEPMPDPPFKTDPNPDCWVSPLYGDFAPLAQRKVPLVISVGTGDMLYPQVDEWVARCENKGIPCTYIVSPGAMHAFTITGSKRHGPVCPDARESLELAIHALKAFLDK